MKLVLPDIVAIGIYNSNIAVKNKTVTNNRKTTMFELEIPIEEGGVSYINSEDSQIDTNTVICAKPGQIRHTRLPYKCYYIHMILREGELYNTLMDLPSFIKTSKYEEYCALFRELIKYYETTLKMDEIMLYSIILKIIHKLEADSQKLLHREKMKSNNFEVIDRIIKYIKGNLTADLSLEALSKIACLSPVYFHNCFKASTGKNVREYVEEQRLKRAANMLISTDKTLTEIAYLCGFSSQSYFSYAFRRKMGQTPREYAKDMFLRYEKDLS